MERRAVVQKRKRNTRALSRRHGRKKISFLSKLSVCSALLILTLTCTVFGGSFVSAQDNSEASPATYQVYESITIQPGDTLWSIATEFLPTEDASDDAAICEYISVIKKVNNLTSDSIEEGQKLIVVYDDTF